MDSTFDHASNEQKWRKFWAEGDFFHADVESTKESYVVLIPPPNVTDRLHMGHGLNNTIQDIYIRWKRMSGFNCLWLPGTDHAGISTQMMVEKSLQKEGRTRKDLGRDAFIQRCQEWKDKNGGIIIEQLKRLGASCDWAREAYTMDPKLSRAVRHIFVKLYNQGLIYRGERLVNWDPVLETAVSDDEVTSEEMQGSLWFYRYPVQGSDEFIPIATTRPETMLGDTAVAVNPLDERYKHLIGKNAILPLVGRVIPIIADDYVKSEYGTGCVKITPAHDPNDFAIGKRHNLPMINILNSNGTLNENCPQEFVGLDRFVARKLVVKRIKELDLFDKEQGMKHTVPLSERSKTPIEPMLSHQWFVKMAELAAPAIEYARKDELRFYPSQWKKTYFHWLENIQDWCISRQLWWGHRIPIWYCDACDAIMTGLTDPTHCDKCQSTALRQDDDVLDTWFSSWLWPLSPFGWPEETPELKKFFPSNVLVTGPDIIFLWVARMIMASHFTRGQLAFKDVYFNSIICDKKGIKFSKTLGNGIDPLEAIDRFGADAVRYTCVSLNSLAGRVRMDIGDMEHGGRFVTKLWNAARFFLGRLDQGWTPKKLETLSLDLPSRWLIHELHRTAQAMAIHLENYEIADAAERLFQFVWRSTCDWGLEAAKVSVEENAATADHVYSVLNYVFEGMLRLAAPFIPFVAEEIWHQLPRHPDWDHPASLVIARFPEAAKIPSYTQDAEQWQIVQAMISGIRSVRTQAQVPPKEVLSAYVHCKTDASRVALQGVEKWIARLANVSPQALIALDQRPNQSLVAVGESWTVYVPVAGFLDVEKEQARLQTELMRVAKIISGLESKLGSENFIQRAPEDVVDQTKKQLANMQAQRQTIADNLSAMVG